MVLQVGLKLALYSVEVGVEARPLVCSRDARTAWSVSAAFGSLGSMWMVLTATF